MKQLLLTALILTIGIGNIFCQSIEIGLHTGIGISGNSIGGKSEWIQQETHSRFTPVELSLNYQFLSSKKIKPFIGSGLNFSNNTYYYNVQSLEFGYNIERINFSQKHISAPIRLGLDINMFGGNSFGFQYELLYNFAIKKEEVFSGTGTAVFESLDYDYVLTNRTKNYLSNMLSIYLKTQITTQLYLFTSVGYGIIPNSGDFDFSTDQIQTNTSQETGMQTQHSSSYKVENEEINNNIVVFKIGITKKF